MATEFEKFALNHEKHKHCWECGACILDPDPRVQDPLLNPVWCIGCVRKIESRLPNGARVPWSGGVRFTPQERSKGL